jgi:antitoxin ParD1/3/4
MPTRNINLTDHYDQFAQNEIAVGRYKNASEVLRAELRLLERRAREDQE